MHLFHGSDVVVQKPVLSVSRRTLDFGPGFYLTSSIDQAQKWAKIVSKRRQSNCAVLNAYEYDEVGARSVLKILQFQCANKEWLEFVCANRKGKSVFIGYDVVIGPVANDSTLPVIDDYMDGVYTVDEAVRRLLPQNLTDQYTLLTEKALAFLAFKESTALL